LSYYSRFNQVEKGEKSRKSEFRNPKPEGKYRKKDEPQKGRKGEGWSLFGMGMVKALQPC